MIEFSMITTRGGDRGQTSLLGGERRSKADDIFDLLGSLDELSSALGVFRALLRNEAESRLSSVRQGDLDIGLRCEDQALRTRSIQEDLVKLGGLVALPREKLAELAKEYLGPAAREEFWEKRIEVLEGWEKDDLPGIELKGFVLPGDMLVSAQGDMARSICRRVERLMVARIQHLGLDQLIPGQRYLNRLSDLLFIMCRSLDLLLSQGSRI